MKKILKKTIAMNYRFIIILILVQLIFQSVSAQGNSETRNFIKTLPVGRETYSGGIQ